jgi:translation initiation factor IF-3
VRLVGANKEMLGVMSLDEALDLADEEELDVILISPDADPPVCRLVSYDKFKYEEEKAKKVQSKKQREGRCGPHQPPLDRPSDNHGCASGGT